ncbi:MAG: diaminopimelate decarboxylase [Bacteroidales bacterium]|nr:diaminopimelate decarboxylase [Bacteroidales bacterium]
MEIKDFSTIQTPCYYYDMDVLHKTLQSLKKESDDPRYVVHYAIKANANPKILKTISSYGFGADCVSANEIVAAIESGFDPKKIVFAGVGKTDKEIETALRAGIGCFNCESLPEIVNINEIAGSLKMKAKISIRINPLIDAHTHKYITIGIEESKFGIIKSELLPLIKLANSMENVEFIGIHFHIGSQITDMSVFRMLCTQVNEFQELLSDNNITIKTINVGGGLGVSYDDPETYPSFANYFKLFKELINLKPGQTLHFEPGRSVVCQCGTLLTRVVYIKEGYNTKFAIVDAGMNDLIRPALYQAHHKIETLTSKGHSEYYDVVGPICESSDVFGKKVKLSDTKRGDILGIRSAGAYGEVMASRYNLRCLPSTAFSDEL